MNSTVGLHGATAGTGDEHFFGAVFDRAPVGMMVRDSELRIVRANKAMQEMLGYAGDPLNGLDSRLLVHADDLAPAMTLDRELLCGRRDFYQIEGRFRHRDGRYLWCKVDTSRLSGSDGHAPRSVSVVEDISDRKHFDASLMHALSRYELIVNTARWGVVDVDAGHRIMFANPFALEVLDWAEDSLLGRPLGAMLRTAGCSGAAAIRAAAADGLIRHAEGMVLQRRDGAPLYVECTLMPMVCAGMICGATLVFQLRPPRDCVEARC